ncbi:hypothetical protein T265_11703 [Opisthorchis viverrini]|uniref:EF-hand domain-containing protein n=1 Tax=Opisthorchis viverrini TaxID=6198 RepID=A0A074YY18_OPIVI|nr:hypothetical protein T265_11703 [Opisthorchis viverrini]KER19568.1 hypothetical protein T265_11703 [Opisthorchis viverrini]
MRGANLQVELSDSDQLQTQIRHDERRWSAADLDEDGKLSFPEFAMFLHPHLYPVMRAVLSAEVLETMDQDKDAQVSEEEYISEIARAHRRVFYRGLPQPPWVDREKVQFRMYLDLDKNGSLDQQEIGEWLFPKDYDEVDSEVLHLLLYLDSNQDGALTRSEVLQDLHLFLRSQRTPTKQLEIIQQENAYLICTLILKTERPHVSSRTFVNFH